jgi:hypothetical protein
LEDSKLRIEDLRNTSEKKSHKRDKSDKLNDKIINEILRDSGIFSDKKKSQKYNENE